MKKDKKNNKITNKPKPLKKSKSLKKTKDSDTSSSKGFSKTYLLIGLILIIGLGIGLYFLLRDNSDDKEKEKDGNKNDEDSSNENKKSNNTLIIVLSVIGFVYITGVLFAFYNKKGALSFASWFSLFFGSGKSSIEERDSEKSENKGSGKKDKAKQIKDKIRNEAGKARKLTESAIQESLKKGKESLSSTEAVKAKKSKILEGIQEQAKKLKDAGERKLKEKSEKKDMNAQLQEVLSKRREVIEGRK